MRRFLRLRGKVLHTDLRPGDGARPIVFLNSLGTDLRIWDAVLPGRVLTVKYESVIDNVEAEVRRILDYCGLPFEAGCLAFHETQRAVRTASSEQVRQPIYTDAVEQWQHYAPYLAPMQAELTDWILDHEKNQA